MKKQQAVLSVLAILIVTLVGGFSAFAAETPIQVTARLSANTVAIAGTVQNSEVTEIGVLILRKEADFDQLGSDDIVYANQYALDENGAFSFEAELPSADLKGYILQIGGGEGLLYRKLLDGNELPESSSSSSGSQGEGSSSNTSSSSDSESGSGAEGQQSSGSSSDNSSLISSDSSSESNNENTVNTGGSQSFLVWGIFLFSAVIVLAGIVVMTKKGGNQHE